MSLLGKVGIVTGGGAGIGRGIALALASAEAHVVIASRDRRRGEETEQELGRRGRAGGRWVPCDVTEPDQVRDVVARTVAASGRLDFVVHNATADGSNAPLPLGSIGYDDWRRHADVALTGAWSLARHAATPLAQTSGSFLVLTSTAAYEGNADLPLYATVKGGQRGFVVALAQEWGPRSVRVNGLVPFADSPALRAAESALPGLRERHRARTALPWLGDPETDIGPAAVFLVSDAARYVTGQTLFVNGGAVMR